MKILYFIIYALYYMIDFTTLTLIFLYYLKQKQRVILYYLLVQLFFNVIITIMSAEFFAKTFLRWYVPLDILWIRLANHGSIGAILYLLPLLIHKFLGKRMNLTKKIIFGFLTVSCFSIVFLPSFITPAGRGFTGIQSAIRFYLFAVIYLEIIYLEILCILSYRNVARQQARIILGYIITLFGLLILLIGIDFYRMFFHVWMDWEIITIAPFVLFLIDFASIFLFARLYFLKPFAPEEGVSDWFLNQYIITGREKEIILLLAKGLANKQIGAELDISEKTVKNHVYNIFRKAGVQGRVELLNKIREIP